MWFVFRIEYIAYKAPLTAGTRYGPFLAPAAPP